MNNFMPPSLFVHKWERISSLYKYGHEMRIKDSKRPKNASYYQDMASVIDEVLADFDKVINSDAAKK